jgi:hypothetical protein
MTTPWKPPKSPSCSPAVWPRRAAHEFWDAHADVLPGGDTHALQFEKDLPLDNLDANILCADALFTPWPEVDAIIGNPPFLATTARARGKNLKWKRSTPR